MTIVVKNKKNLEKKLDSEYIKFVQGNQQYNQQIKITKAKDCDNKVIEYYKYEEQKVYLVCLDEIKLDDATLKDYFSKTYQTFDDSINNLINSMKLVDTYKDGELNFIRMILLLL